MAKQSVYPFKQMSLEDRFVVSYDGFTLQKKQSLKVTLYTCSKYAGIKIRISDNTDRSEIEVTRVA